jgi:glycerol-3-phosphate dehydrogenase subunit C
MREGSLDAPVRHPLEWEDPDFYDEEKLDQELRRVFDICHGCRRCFNLCDSFPRLFDLIDDSKTGELDSVASTGFKPIVDACTLCDMCFMSKCPYVPPHEFNLDFPHLMLRYRAVERQKGKSSLLDDQLRETDRNGKIGCGFSAGANWATSQNNKLTRPLLQAVAGIHKDAYLPPFASKPLDKQLDQDVPELNVLAPAYGRKAVIYATCFSNYNNPDIARASLLVLAANGVETKLVYPECCGMPQMEGGDIARVAEKARNVSSELEGWIDDGWDVIGLVPSCSLMLKFEWPLILPGDAGVKKLSNATFDIAEYIVDIARDEGLADGMQPVGGDITVHISCHSRAQNMGQKAAELLRLIPDSVVMPIERCSGHGGAWGVKKENFDVALKVGKPVARTAAKNASAFVVSECPLAREHILQGMEKLEADTGQIKSFQHPVEILAHAYSASSEGED